VRPRASAEIVEQIAAHLAERGLDRLETWTREIRARLSGGGTE
jgi:hypothetical protein